MNKKGFIFLETVSILMVVALSLITLLASYTLVYTKSLQHKYYDQPRDLYTLYSVANLIDTSSLSDNVIMVSNANSCELNDGKTTVLGETINDCSDFMNKINMVTFAVVDDINAELNKKSSETYYDNITIEYLKTLPRCYEQKCTKSSKGRKYLLGIFKREGKYYYASIEV